MTARPAIIAVCFIAALGTAFAQPQPQPAQGQQRGQSPQGQQRVQPLQPVRTTTGRGGAEQPAGPNTAIAPRPPRREGQPINVRVDFTITDQRAGSAPIKRTLSMIVADGRTGMIRSQAEVIGVSGGNVPLNIDTSPELLADGKIRLGFNLQYDMPAPIEGTNPAPRGTVLKTAMHDSVSLILESGKPMVAAQSADPIGDRQVSVEVKATVMR